MSAVKHTPWLSVTAMMRAEAAGMDAANAAGQRANGDSARLRSDADEIDRRCNSHDALVEALERLVNYNDCPDFANKLDREAQEATDGNVSAWEVLYDAARAAIAAAKVRP